MIYIQDEDKENIHPNIIANKKRVQFSDKFKRYPDSNQLQSVSSLQITASKPISSPKMQKVQISKIQNRENQPEVSYFEIDQLKNISKQISLKEVSRISSIKSKQLSKQTKKDWRRMIMKPSQAQMRLLQKIDNMLQKQTLIKPVYSQILKNKKKAGSFNTMASDAILNSQYQSQSNKSSLNNSKTNSPEGKDKSSTLEELINISKLSKLSNISNRTLEKYLMCLERGRNSNQRQKEQKVGMGMCYNDKDQQQQHKVSQFNWLQTDRSKDITFTIQNKKGRRDNEQIAIQSDEKGQIEQLKKEISEIYNMIVVIMGFGSKDEGERGLREKIREIRRFVKDRMKIGNVSD